MPLFLVVGNSLGRNSALGKIKDLPVHERPREKAIRYGIETLADYELLALIIGSGYKGHSALDVSYDLLSKKSGLINVIGLPYVTLSKYSGIGKDKALKILAAFEIAKRFQSLKDDLNYKLINSNYIYQRYINKLMSDFDNQEFLFLVILDKKKNIIHETNLYKGNENSVNYSIKQIIKKVIQYGGRFFYIIHNHPSGSLKPSPDDCSFTMNLIADCKNLGLTLCDHLIISSMGYYSFLEQNVIYKS